MWHQAGSKTRKCKSMKPGENYQINPNLSKLCRSMGFFGTKKGIRRGWLGHMSSVASAIHGLHGSVIPPQNVIQHPAWQRSSPVLDYLQYIIVQQQDWEPNNDVFSCIKDITVYLLFSTNSILHLVSQAVWDDDKRKQIRLMRRSDTTKSTKANDAHCAGADALPHLHNRLASLLLVSYTRPAQEKWKLQQSYDSSALPVRKACSQGLLFPLLNTCKTVSIYFDLFPAPFTLYISLYLFVSLYISLPCSAG